MIRRWHVGAIAIVLVANAGALVRVALDRRDPPKASLWLTERELRLLAPELESSLLFVRLTWIREDDGVDVLGEDTLRRLGFDCTTPVDDPRAVLHYDSQLARPAWLLLEYEGDAWKAWQERGGAERRAENSSRLFPVAVGADPAETRSRCSDPERCILLPVHVRPRVHQPRQGKSRLQAWIFPDSGSEIALPSRLREVVAGLPAGPNLGEGSRADLPPPRYRARLVIGREQLPRVDAVELLANP